MRSRANLTREILVFQNSLDRLNHHESWESKLPPPKPPSPINKALLRDYEGTMVGSDTLIIP